MAKLPKFLYVLNPKMRKVMSFYIKEETETSWMVRSLTAPHLRLFYDKDSELLYGTGDTVYVAPDEPGTPKAMVKMPHVVTVPGATLPNKLRSVTQVVDHFQDAPPPPARHR